MQIHTGTSQNCKPSLYWKIVFKIGWRRSLRQGKESVLKLIFREEYNFFYSLVVRNSEQKMFLVSFIWYSHWCVLLMFQNMGLPENRSFNSITSFSLIANTSRNPLAYWFICNPRNTLYGDRRLFKAGMQYSIRRGPSLRVTWTGNRRHMPTQSHQRMVFSGDFTITNRQPNPEDKSLLCEWIVLPGLWVKVMVSGTIEVIRNPFSKAGSSVVFPLCLYKSCGLDAVESYA